MALRVALSLLLAVVSLLAPRPTGGAESLLGRRVARFQIYSNIRRAAHPEGAGPGGPLGVVLALAEHANVRICFEERPLRKGEKQPRIDIRVTDKTVGEILQILVRKDRHYEYRERLGVIEVLPVGADKDPADCLNMVVPALHVHYPWKWAWGAVRCEILLLSENPGRIVPEPFTECSGASHAAHPPEKMLEATFEKRTVRDILDELSSMAGNVAWYATYDGPSPSCKNLVLGEYDPLTWYPPEREGEPWIEGLTKKCTTCHYHTPAPSD
jgi:hypothetical protein